MGTSIFFLRQLFLRIILFFDFSFRKYKNIIEVMKLQIVLLKIKKIESVLFIYAQY